jgi:3',5'-nucleoside bisphosphate phosphatase
VKSWRAELHVHTVLSPCADVEMIPPLIVSEALDQGIDLIAITDHNSSANVVAVQQAAEGTGLIVLPGMELQTREEVHLLCLFQENAALAAWQQAIDRLLPKIANRPDYFGEQFVVDATGDFIRREDRLLLTSAEISIDKAILEIHRLGGLAIPAHVDRKAFGLIENLGFLPEGAPVEAVEYSRHFDLSKSDRTYPQLKGVPRIQSGDVHRLSEFLGVNQLTLEAPTLPEIRLALAGVGGRRLDILPKPC